MYDKYCSAQYFDLSLIYFKGMGSFFFASEYCVLTILFWPHHTSFNRTEINHSHTLIYILLFTLIDRWFVIHCSRYNQTVWRSDQTNTSELWKRGIHLSMMVHCVANISRWKTWIKNRLQLIFVCCFFLNQIRLHSQAHSYRHKKPPPTTTTIYSYAKLI